MFVCLNREEWLQYKADYLNTQRTNMAMLKKMLMEKTKQQGTFLEKNSFAWI